MDRYTGEWHDCYGPPGALTPLSKTVISRSNLQACIGECDRDSQCAAGLKCLQRSYDESIPGCTGPGGGPTWDYCYDPTSSDEPVTEFGMYSNRDGGFFGAGTGTGALYILSDNDSEHEMSPKYEVTTAYFRAGYAPTDYPDGYDGIEWQSTTTQ